MVNMRLEISVDDYLKKDILLYFLNKSHKINVRECSTATQLSQLLTYYKQSIQTSILTAIFSDLK